MNLLLLAAEEAGEGGLRVVLPLMDELIVGTFAFLVFLAVMYKLVFPNMRKALRAREDAIRGELERAEQARLDSEEQREQLRRQLADARGQADQILRDETAAAEQVRRDIIAKAEEEARQIVARARTDAEGERDRAFGDLRSQMAEISIEAARRVVERELSDPAAQRTLVDQFIASVGSGSGSDSGTGNGAGG
ncbi:MAG TPA: F0F1 ATP synthase subunit B [Actinomycetota bacterium]|nr:F0F1 ATP synthase subunit B [Actinomycetota bacterium]